MRNKNNVGLGRILSMILVGKITVWLLTEQRVIHVIKSNIKLGCWPKVKNHRTLKQGCLWDKNK